MYDSLAARAGVTTGAAGKAIQGAAGLIHQKQLSAGRNYKASIRARPGHIEDVRNRVCQRPDHRPVRHADDHRHCSNQHGHVLTG
jgi:hypothetical protein